MNHGNADLNCIVYIYSLIDGSKSMRSLSICHSLPLFLYLSCDTAKYISKEFTGLFLFWNIRHSVRLGINWHYKAKCLNVSHRHAASYRQNTNTRNVFHTSAAIHDNFNVFFCVVKDRYAATNLIFGVTVCMYNNFWMIFILLSPKIALCACVAYRINMYKTNSITYNVNRSAFHKFAVIYTQMLYVIY